MRNGALVMFAVFARFSLDSARTRNPTAKMAATQKINRAALDVFILTVFFTRQHSGYHRVETRLTLCGSSNPNIAQAPPKKASRILRNSGNKKVTDLLPAKCEARPKIQSNRVDVD
jgi:hypothetical protein